MAIEDENNYGLSGVQVKELVAQVKKRAVSVGEDGSSHVEEADQIYTKTLQLQEAAFVYRTTAGDLSIETGEANLLKLYGKTVQEGHVDEVKDFSYENLGDGITATIDWAAFEVNQYVQTYGPGLYRILSEPEVGEGWWALRSPDGRKILEVRAASSVAQAINVSLSANPTWSADAHIDINYQPLVIGTLTTAKPTSFVSTGYNQYNATAGYAHVIGGKEYRIDGTYTSLGFTEEIGGATTAITVANGKFTPESDGYIYVTGGSGDILIALVWSGTRDSDPYVAYSADTISIPTIDIDSASLPTASYGMPSVGDVADELDFEERLYIQRIGHYAYSAENLETVEALGVDYWYDEEDIFYVLETPVTYHLATSVKSAYTANDFGTEEIVGTSVAMPVMISYGNNLVDKLRNLLPIQAIGDKLEMDGTTLNVAQSALGDVGKLKELTVNDYNYPTDNPQYVAMWLKDDGVYYAPNGLSVRTSQDDTMGSRGGLILVREESLIKHITRIQATVVSNNIGHYAMTTVGVNKTTGSVTNAEAHTIMTGDSVNNLTSNESRVPLSAAQGKVLKDLIDALPIGGAKVLTADDYNYDSDNDGVNDKIYFGYLPAGFYSIGSLNPTNDFWPSMEGGTNKIYAKSFIVSEPYPYNWAQGTTPVVNVYFLGHVSYGSNAVGYNSLPHETIFVIPYYKESVGNVGNPRVALLSTDLVGEFVGNIGAMKVNMPFSGLGAYNMYHDHILPLTGSGAPTASTDAKRIGRTYIDTSTQDVYMCVARTSASDNTWKQIA